MLSRKHTFLPKTGIFFKPCSDNYKPLLFIYTWILDPDNFEITYVPVCIRYNDFLASTVCAASTNCEGTMMHRKLKKSGGIEDRPSNGQTQNYILGSWIIFAIAKETPSDLAGHWSV